MYVHIPPDQIPYMSYPQIKLSQNIVKKCLKGNKANQMISAKVVNIQPVFISLQKFTRKQILEHLYVEMKNWEIQNVAYNFSLLSVYSLTFF